jgi:uncharacterized protein (TIGR03663 family)
MSGSGDDDAGNSGGPVDTDSGTDSETSPESATSQGDRASLDDTPSSLFERYDVLTVPRVIVAVTVLAVVLRIVALGSRTAHWDEARVAYWSYFYTDTGSLAYYWEEHGPLAQIAAARLFGIFGVSDFAARLPVALVGGVLPLGALLYREHLRKSETVALAVLLSVNAVLLYFSRFMRSDVLVATFMFLGLGLVVRFLDTRKLRYLLVSGVVLGLGFASKENAIVYILTWLGASALLVDQFLHSPANEESGFDYLRANFGRYRGRLKSIVYRADYAIGFALTFVSTMVIMFAPRGDGLEPRGHPDSVPVTLGGTVQSPGKLPTLVEEALDEAYRGYVEWFTQSEETTLDTYIDFVSDYVVVLVEYAPLVTAFAIIGILAERYGRDSSRALVMFMIYCGVASLVGYPLGSHIKGDSAWLSVHVIVPLTVPAAVGLSWTYRRGRSVVERTSVPAVAAIVVVVLLLGGWAWAVPVQGVYVDDTAEDNRLVQYAQPASDLGPLIDEMEAAASDGDGTDVVLFYGEEGANFDRDESLIDQDPGGEYEGEWQIEPRCSVWGTTQPLNWYFAVADASVDCERSADALAENVSQGAVPIVITVPGDGTVPEELQSEEYVKRTYDLRNVGQEVIVYTHESVASQ